MHFLSFEGYSNVFVIIILKVLRIRSELRKRKLTSVCVERVLNVQGNITTDVCS